MDLVRYDTGTEVWSVLSSSLLRVFCTSVRACRDDELEVENQVVAGQPGLWESALHSLWIPASCNQALLLFQHATLSQAPVATCRNFVVTSLLVSA